MRKLLVLIVGLLLASGAWAQPSSKGQLANCTNADILAGTCIGDSPGSRAYDTDNNKVMVYDESLAAPEFRNDANSELTDATPAIIFNDTDEADDIDGTFVYNCAVANTCLGIFSVKAGGVISNALRVQGNAGLGEYDIFLGGDGTNHVIIDETGAMTFEGTGDINLPADSVDPADISSTMCSQVLFVSFDPDETQITYADITDSSAAAVEATEDNFRIPNTATLSVAELYCSVNVAPGVGNDDWKMTVRSGAPGALSDTIVTCSIDEAQTECNDSTNSEALTQLDALTIELDQSGDDADPAAATLMYCAFCLTN